MFRHATAPFAVLMMLVAVLCPGATAPPQGLEERLPDLQGSERLAALQALAQEDWAVNPRRSIARAEEALALCEELGATEELATCTLILATSEKQAGKFAEALERSQEALRLAEEAGQVDIAAGALTTIGGIHLEMSRYDLALEYHRKALAARETLKDGALIAASLQNIGLVLWNLGRHDEAMEHYERALELYRRFGLEMRAARTINNIGRLQEQTGDLFAAVASYESALESMIAENQLQSQAVIQNNLANILLELGELDRAREYLVQTRALAEEIGDRGVLATCLRLQARERAARGEYRQAFEALETRNEVVAEWDVEKAGERVAELEARFQVERKDQQIQLLQKDRKLAEAGREKDRILRRVLIGGLALLVGAVIVVLLRYRAAVRTRAEIAKHRDELKEALDKIHVLEGLLPICASCKNIRDDDGYWKQVESYLARHTGARFTHSICPACSAKLYPEFADPER